MKIFKIEGPYSVHFVCAETWIQAIEIFKEYRYPSKKQKNTETKEWLIKRQKEMDISLSPDSEWYIYECNTSFPHCLGGYEG